MRGKMLVYAHRLVRDKCGAQGGLGSYKGSGAILLPTKTSLFRSHPSGSSPAKLRASSHVCFVIFCRCLLWFVLVASILSSMSLLLIVCCQRLSISPSECILPRITLSHRRTQIVYADSVIKICSNLIAPWVFCFLRVSSFVWGRSGAVMLPAPSMIPIVRSGQGG